MTGEPKGRTGARHPPHPGSAEFWLRRQATYDLAQARKREHRIKVARYEPRSAVAGDPEQWRES